LIQVVPHPGNPIFRRISNWQKHRSTLCEDVNPTVIVPHGQHATVVQGRKGRFISRHVILFAVVDFHLALFPLENGVVAGGIGEGQHQIETAAIGQFYRHGRHVNAVQPFNGLRNGCEIIQHVLQGKKEVNILSPGQWLCIFSKAVQRKRAGQALFIHPVANAATDGNDGAAIPGNPL